MTASTKLQSAAQQPGWSREEMAQRVGADIPDGAYVNLGVGIPEKVAQYVPAGREVIYHTENGLLGMGPAPAEGQEDPELINADAYGDGWIVRMKPSGDNGETMDPDAYQAFLDELEE